VDWVRVDNLSEEWEQTEDCKNFDYKENIDWFKGTYQVFLHWEEESKATIGICDLQVKGGATSGASCCRYCNDNPRCKGFTFFSGQCFLKSCNDRGHMKNARLENAISASQK
jgi:hypothetical protein